MDTSSAVLNQSHSQNETLTLTDSERNALRAFLQRCEVRLSTMHRVAVAFVSGAGILLLIPIFFKDVIDALIVVLLAQAGNFFPELGSTGGWLVTLALYGLLLYPLLLSLSVPLYALYLLLKDIVHFYFTIYTPSFPASLLNPTFSLTGLTLWADESPGVKRAVMRHQYAPEQMDFMMPFSENKRAQYFDTLIKNTNGEIIPPTRRLELLRSQDLLSTTNGEKDVQRFNAVFGITRSLDRTLIEDVAMTEMALARSAMYLRRLLLRYFKTLLMFIWTALIAFIMLPFVKDNRLPTFIVLAVGYIVWSLLVMRIMRLPLTWIYRHRYDSPPPDHIDAQLTLLERNVRPFVLIGILTACVGLLVAVAAHLG